VRRYYKRWPLGTRERIMIDVYLFTGFRRGDAASFGPADVTEQVQERIGLDGRIEKVTVPIITKRLEKGDKTIEVTFPSSMSCAGRWRLGRSEPRPTSRLGAASR
jgi:cytochrome c oxidase assembly protein Cox11